MLNFTTETILNDLTKVSYLLGALSAPGSGVNWDPGIEVGKNAIFIKRLNKFVVNGTKEKIKNNIVYKREATPAVLATRLITIPTVVIGTLYRVGVQITTNGYADGQFARDRVTYGKPFYVEVIATATTDTVLATALANAWNTTFASYDNFVTATTSGADLIFTADTNPFIQFKSLILESINITTGVAVDLVATVSAGTPGTPPFGDYTDLIKSHRLPTLDNFRPYGLNQEELPVVGATYDQYSFEYLANRGSMGRSVVGQNADSKTTHIIWVNTSAPDVTLHITGTLNATGSYAFDEILQAIGITVTDPSDGSDITPSPVTETGGVTTTTIAPTTTTTTTVGP
jgi:hypothetical protein